MPSALNDWLVLAADATTDGDAWWMKGYLTYALLAVVVVTAAIFDLRTGRIPNRLLYPSIVAGFVLAGVLGWARADWAMAGLSEGVGMAGISFVAAAAPTFLIYTAGGLGGGDVKLIAAIGAVAADWEVVLGAAMYGFILAMLLAVYLMIRHGIVRKTLKRIAGAAVLAASRIKPELDKDSPQVRLGPCFGIGALVAGVEFLLGVPMPWS